MAPTVSGDRSGTMDADRTRTLYSPPLRVTLVTRAGVRSPLAAARIARAVVAALESARAPQPCSVTVVLTDDVELAELNVAHLGHEGPTDVLSFPMLEPTVFDRIERRDANLSEIQPAAGGVREARRERPAGERGRAHLGDIAISVERAIEQAVEGRGGQTGDVRWSAADELRLLVTHGTLHLCGWDHAEPAEEAAMRDLERRLLG